MSIDKYKITRLTNIKPIDMSKIQMAEKDGGIVMNYHQTILTQIVEAQEKREFECICAEIQRFIEKNNIDVCFAINKDEIIDCLQGHQKLKLELADKENELALTEKAFELACEMLCGLSVWDKLEFDNAIKDTCEYFKTKAKEMMESE